MRITGIYELMRIDMSSSSVQGGWLCSERKHGPADPVHGRAKCLLGEIKT